MEAAGFTLWHDGTSTVHQEEVICGIDNGCAIIQEGGAEGSSYEEVCEEVVVQEDGVVTETIVPEMHEGELETSVSAEGGNIVYLTANNMLVVPQLNSVGAPVVAFQDNFMECQVTEEVITDDWVNSQGEERVEIPVGEVGAEQQIEYDDMEVPLPIDQDEYTASRPYPCDFCSRRFRKKANLMNHMVAHQTDRPHGCNLCGARYIRKCDLMNHLKIHAYVPDPDALDDEELPPPSYDDDGFGGSNDRSPLKKKKPGKRSRKSSGSAQSSNVGLQTMKHHRIKQEVVDDMSTDERYDLSSARSYSYVEEDVRLLAEMENHLNSGTGTSSGMMKIRYPITDSRKPFVCQHCGVAFAREKALASHARIHAGDSPFECETCNEMFWDRQLLRDHVSTKHGGMLTSGTGSGIGGSGIGGGGGTGGIGDSDYDEFDDEEYIDDSSYGDFYCKVCGMRFHRTDLLRRHMRNHDDVKEEFNTDTEYGHVCNVCGQSFNEALDLLAHAESHARQMGHRCMLCGECFTDETTMANHVMQRHGKNMPPNTCMLCGKTCKDRRTLLKHSWDHSREKLFSCSKCGKSFHNKARLKRHMVSHRNKAVQCDVCGEDFPDGRSLMNHRHSHSNISGRQFPCRECGKTFGSRSSQQIHIRIHTGERPYGCRFCWKAFADGGTLRKHERIHTGEKPYACAVCPRAFNQRVVLREHIRSHHSGPDPAYSNTMTPFCCSVCNDMFSTSQDLIIHLIHHCDMNTALKRQPQIGPRKYKRRRKLKPHELEMISNRMEHDQDEMGLYDSDEQHQQRTSTSNRRRSSSVRKSPKQASAATGMSSASAAANMSSSSRGGGDNKSNLEKDYESVFQSFESASQIINSIVNSKPTTSARGRKKTKMSSTSAGLSGTSDGLQGGSSSLSSRPKMIHTQKTRVPVDSHGDGRGRHKTKTLITRTTPMDHHHQQQQQQQQLKAAAAAAAAEAAREKERAMHSGSERNRPRTKNVSYHVLQADKLPLATFGDQEQDGQDQQEQQQQQEEEEDGGIGDDGYQENNNGFSTVIIKPDPDAPHHNDEETIHMEYQTVETEIPDVANEETVLAAQIDDIETSPTITTRTNNNANHATMRHAKITPKRYSNTNNRRNNSLTPGRHLIGPGNKIIRIVKGGMLISNNRVKKEPIDESEINNGNNITTSGSGDDDGNGGGNNINNMTTAATTTTTLKHIKQEIIEPSPLHELAELSMQHAQNQFRCEMCSATFTDRSQLLMHVPIHI